jgi:type IV pilus assembly protein PilY1
VTRHRHSECRGPAARCKRLKAFSLGLTWSLLSLTAALAEDVEIFTGAYDPSTIGQPNILFILDDSGSMGAEIITQNDYDPFTIYDGGSCNADPNRVYFSTTGSTPACDSQNYFALSSLVCQRALDALTADQGGTYRDQFAQFNPDEQLRWERLSGLEPLRLVECADDLPDPSVGWPGHGDGSNSAAVYPRNGDAAARWTSEADAPDRVTWGAFPTDYEYTIFSGNYLNWYHSPGTVATRLEIMQAVTLNIINSMNGVNVGLMRFNGNEGGLVAHAVSDVETSRATLTAAVNDLVAGGSTPLSESLYEAYLYLSGRAVDYGFDGVAEARRAAPNDNLYDSPLELSCQKNHIVLLTDGEPVLDTSANAKIQSLVDYDGQSFQGLVGGSCDVETYPPGFSPDGGECLDDLAEFMHRADLSPLAGTQSVTTHTVGLFVDLPVLEETADRGGGEYHTATDTASLIAALSEIVSSVYETQTTFTAPSVSVNAFNQTRNLNDVYLGLFQPSMTAHWPGNLKKFRLSAAASAIVDANGEPIIDAATGIFGDYVQDFWSADEDGANVTSGGAASRIPNIRNVYTFLGNPDLTSLSNRITTTNLDDAMLGTGDPDLPSAQDVVDFINGIDVADSDGDGDSFEPRRQLGDPLHSAPVVVIYGPDSDDALVFMGTNDGMLHAFDADDGSEAWAFLPPEFLGQQLSLLLDEATDSKTYGVDGSIRIQTIGDTDGVVEAADGERVLLFFGMRRGGDAYYALDVTDPDSPEVLWNLDSGDLPGLGQSWSSVTPTRVDIQGASQNQYQLALVVGGGYDASQDAAASSMDANGNSIFILDTLTGDLLWQASSDSGDQRFSTGQWGMDYSIPADVRVIDLNGDGFGDRMYAADMGGQVWRFDIRNGNPASSLVAGGVIAQLGAAGTSAPTLAETRRFYYAPDVAVVSNRNYGFIHLGIGSGHRAHPNSTDNEDEFFALRDYASFAPMTQSQYDGLTPIRPQDLVDVTSDITGSVPQGSPGWRLRLNDGGWRGEKVLAEARTFSDQVFVSTYRPNLNGGGCEPSFGTTRQYVMSLFNGAPVTNLDGSLDETNLTLTDRYREFQGPPPPETVFLFPYPEQDLDGNGIDDGVSLECAADGECLGEIICIGLVCTENDEPRYPVRTFWREQGID